MVEQAQAGPPIISRINRLDNVVKHLEELRGGSWRSSWESSESPPSSGSPSTCSDGRSWASVQCRPLDDVVSEVQHKGTLLYRLSHLEDRVLECAQICLQVEKEREHHNINNKEEEEAPHTPTKKGLKQLVRSCVKPKSKSKSK
ncbi:hypothetical protein V2J09_018343 [Rumex salicifolius]